MKCSRVKLSNGFQLFVSGLNANNALDFYVMVKRVAAAEIEHGFEIEVKKLPETESIIDFLASEKIDSSFIFRKKIASVIGIKDYVGLDIQNIEMIRFLKGKTILLNALRLLK